MIRFVRIDFSWHRKGRKVNELVAENDALDAQAAVKQYFAGKYIDSLRDVYVASLLSGLNSVAIGAPGYGKTDVALSILGDMFSPGEYTFTRLSPTTPAEAVEGPVDIQKLMSVSEFERKVAGTPMDGQMQAHLVDEIFRANSMVLQSLMFVSDRKDLKFAPPVLATANFLPRGEEFEALLDRFGLWHWVEPSAADAGAIARSKLMGGAGRLHVPGNLPTTQDIGEIHFAAEQPGLRAVEAVAGVIEQLAADVAAEGLTVNPRRVTAWAHLLYRCGVYYSGSADFQAVPDAAMRLLRFAWRAATPAEAQRWTQLAGSVADPVAAAVEQVLADGAKLVNDALVEAAAKPGNKDAIVGAATRQLHGLLQALIALGNDPRAAEANALIMTWFGALAAGRKIER